jgi:hypothetical protein
MKLSLATSKSPVLTKWNWIRVRMMDDGERGDGKQ